MFTAPVLLTCCFHAQWASIKKKYVPAFTDLAKEMGSEVNVATVTFSRDNLAIRSALRKIQQQLLNLVSRTILRLFSLLEWGFRDVLIAQKKYAVYRGSIHHNALKELVSETYKYLDYKSIPKAPSPLIAYMDVSLFPLCSLIMQRVVNYLERQLSTSPLLICGIFVFVGIVCGVFLVLIGELVTQPVEAPSPIKEDYSVC